MAARRRTPVLPIVRNANGRYAYVTLGGLNQGTGSTPKRYLVIVPGKPDSMGAPVQVPAMKTVCATLLLSATGTIMDTPASADGVISRPSPYAVDETVRRLEEVVRGKGLAVFARVDHHAAAREAGLEMQEEQVLIFGNPRGGTPLMVARPLVGLDLPLRVLVWRAADGHVWVSYQESAFIARRFGLPAGLEKNIAAVPGLVETALR